MCTLPSVVRTEWRSIRCASNTVVNKITHTKPVVGFATDWFTKLSLATWFMLCSPTISSKYTRNIFGVLSMLPLLLLITFFHHRTSTNIFEWNTSVRLQLCSNRYLWYTPIQCAHISTNNIFVQGFVWSVIVLKSRWTYFSEKFFLRWKKGTIDIQTVFKGILIQGRQFFEFNFYANQLKI